MKREIRFRAWHKETQKMHFEVVPMCFDHPFQSELWGYIGSTGEHAQYDLDEFEVMQWTGLKDRTGREVWEGDIVRWNEWRLGAKSIDGTDFPLHNNKIIWSEEESGWRIEGKSFPLAIYSNIEVIGNIFEHPDLLPGEKGGGTNDTQINQR